MDKDIKKGAESGCCDDAELRAERTLSEAELALITGGANQPQPEPQQTTGGLVIDPTQSSQRIII